MTPPRVTQTIGTLQVRHFGRTHWDLFDTLTHEIVAVGTIPADLVEQARTLARQPVIVDELAALDAAAHRHAGPTTDSTVNAPAASTGYRVTDAGLAALADHAARRDAQIVAASAALCLHGQSVGNRFLQTHGRSIARIVLDAADTVDDPTPPAPALRVPPGTTVDARSSWDRSGLNDGTAR